MKTSVIILLFALVFCNALSQTADVRGVVSDSVTGERLPSANVIIKELNKGVSTNTSGFYLIPNVSPGVYEITASYVGYLSKTMTVVVKRQQPTFVNFLLQPEAIQMGEVVVSGRPVLRMHEINTSVHDLDKADIKRVPVAMQEDLFRAIQLLPGIVSTSDVSSQFYVRGGASDQNLVLFDGMKIYNPFHAFGLFSSIDPEVLKYAQVWLGAFPAGFGGRLSSIVSVDSRDGRSDRTGGSANFNMLSGSVHAEGNTTLFGDGTWIASARKSYYNKMFKNFFDKELPLSFYDSFFKLSSRDSAAGRISIEALVSGDDLKSSNPDEPDYAWRSQSIGINISGLIAERVYVMGAVYDSRFSARRDAKSSNFIKPTSTSVQDMGVHADAMFYGESNDFYNFGFDVSFPILEYELVNRTDTQIHLRTQLSEFYAWIRYQQTSRNGGIDVGVHTDVGSLFQRGSGIEALQLRINLSRKIWSDWTAKFSYGRFNQNVITVNNEDDVIAIFDAWIYVPEKLKPESADHFVAGISGNPIPNLSFDVQTYMKYYGSLVLYNIDKIDATDPDYVNGFGNSFGLETLLRYAEQWYDFYLSYTWGWTMLTVNGLSYHPRYDRKHSVKSLSIFKLSANWKLSIRWELGSGLPFSQTIGYYDRIRTPNLFREYDPAETGVPYAQLGPKNAARLPVFHRMDISLTHEFRFWETRGSLGAHLINAYNRKNIFYFDRKTGQRINMLPFFPSITMEIQY